MNILICNSLKDFDDYKIDEVDYDYTILLNGYFKFNSSKKISLLPYIESNDSEIRKNYLKLIYDLENLKVFNKAISEFIKLDNNFSFWSLTLLAEKCNIGKSQQILSVVKLIAIDKIISSLGSELEKHKNSISILSDDKSIIDSLKEYSSSYNFEFHSIFVESSYKEFSLKDKLKKYSPSLLLSLIWLANRIFRFYPLKGVGVDGWINSKAELTCGSYLFNLDTHKLNNQIFYSNYWTSLPNKLNTNNIKSNWIHIFVPDKDISNAKEAKRALENLNNNNEVHTSTDSFMSFSIIYRTIKNYFKIYIKSFFIKKVIKKRLGYLYPLLKEDFQKSFKGISAISNLYYFFLYKKAFSVLPKQKLGIYLLENQGWEAGFNGAYKSHSHLGPTIGIPHSTIRFWDLRYFNYFKIYEESNSYFYSGPSLIAANGPYSKASLLDSGLPSKRIVELEALRYLDNEYGSSSKDNQDADDSFCNVLILGDYSFDKTNKQIKLLEEAYKNIKQNIRFFIKPHPSCPINKNLYHIELELVCGPLDSLLNNADLVYTSNTTSAAVDSFCKGVPVITYLDENDFNLSPLRGFKEVNFVSSSLDMIKILNLSFSKRDNIHQDYFYSRASLEHWVSTLKSYLF